MDSGGCASLSLTEWVPWFAEYAVDAVTLRAEVACRQFAGRRTTSGRLVIEGRRVKTLMSSTAAEHFLQNASGKVELHLDSTIVAERAVVLTRCWATLRERLLQFLLEGVFRHRMHPARTPQPNELTIDFP